MDDWEKKEEERFKEYLKRWCKENGQDINDYKGLPVGMDWQDRSRFINYKDMKNLLKGD